MDRNPVTILEGENLKNIQNSELSIGDIAVFQVGDIIPADIQLIEATNLEIDEFEITGEIIPVHKRVRDNYDFLFMGSRVTNGKGKGFVIAIGDETEYGKILKQEEERNRPKKLKLLRLKYFGLLGLLLPAFLIDLSQSKSYILVIGFYLLCTLLLFLLQNSRILKFWIISHQLKEYKRSEIQIRDPRVLELINDINLYCFDKTGVLTSRHIEVKNLFFPYQKQASDFPFNDEFSFSLVKTACALCNDVQFFEKIVTANPIDKALISFATKNGADFTALRSRYTAIYEQPFDSEKRFMISGFQNPAKEIYFFAKGDPEVIFQMCDYYESASGAFSKLNSDITDIVHTQLRSISSNGNTVIALAYTCGASKQKPLKFIFLCLVQLETPLHPAACKIIQRLVKDNKRAILLTGDRADTALRVAKDIGITNDSGLCLTGKMINKMALKEVARQSLFCSVFARLTPSQKGVLIRLFQQNGNRVIMVGDGPNDGIALKVADIGISFVENSSPIARRLSKIYINDLSDLFTLFNDAKKIRHSIYFWNQVRILIIALILARALLGKIFFS